MVTKEMCTPGKEVCSTELRDEYSLVERDECTVMPEEKCQEVEQEVCAMVPTTECIAIPSQLCDDVVEELCEEKCTPVWWCKVCTHNVEELPRSLTPPLPDTEFIRGGILI